MATTSLLARTRVRWGPALIAITVCGLGYSRAHAAEPLRYGIFDSMGFPFVQQDANHVVEGGLLKELGEKLAREMNTSLQVIALARRRVEPSLTGGAVDIVCYHSPKWSDAPDALLWSVPTLPQIERVVSLRGTGRLTGNVPNDFANKRVVLQLGYHYPSLQPLIDSHVIKRLDESKVPLMFKALELGIADLLVTSEGELEGYFNTNPAARTQFSVSEFTFSIVPTQCAVSPKSPHSLQSIDKALGQLMRRGDIDRLARQYGLSMR